MNIFNLQIMLIPEANFMVFQYMVFLGNNVLFFYFGSQAGSKAHDCHNSISGRKSSMPWGWIFGAARSRLVTILHPSTVSIRRVGDTPAADVMPETHVANV